MSEFFQASNDKRLEEFERDLASRQTALVKLQVRADDDDASSRIIDALAEQVFAECPAFP